MSKDLSIILANSSGNKQFLVIGNQNRLVEIKIGCKTQIYYNSDIKPQSMLTDYFEMKLFEVEKNITNPPLKKRRFRKRGNPSSNEWKKKLEEMNNFNQAQLDLIITQFKEKSEQLVKARHLRGKKLPATLAKINDFAEYVELKKIEHHNGGITAMDMQV